MQRGNGMALAAAIDHNKKAAPTAAVGAVKKTWNARFTFSVHGAPSGH
jgi:hypothetical protein